MLTLCYGLWGSEWLLFHYFSAFKKLNSEKCCGLCTQCCRHIFIRFLIALTVSTSFHVCFSVDCPNVGVSQVFGLRNPWHFTKGLKTPESFCLCGLHRLMRIRNLNITFHSNTNKMPLWTMCSKRKEISGKNGIVQCFRIMSDFIRGRHVVQWE